MISDNTLAAGLRRIAARHGRDVSPDMVRAYRGDLHDLTDEEFLVAVKRSGRECETWPSPAVLLRLARPEGDAHAEGVRVFGQIARCTTYNPAVGDYVSAQRVADELGVPAYRAFIAIGGKDTWADGSPQHRLRDFLAVYEQEIATQRRDNALAQITATRALHDGATHPTRTLTPVQPNTGDC